MQVSMAELYEKTKAEMSMLHERALISEAVVEKLEKENEELRLKLEEAQGKGDVEEEEDAYLEKLKQEVPDVKPE